MHEGVQCFTAYRLKYGRNAHQVITQCLSGSRIQVSDQLMLSKSREFEGLHRNCKLCNEGVGLGFEAGGLQIAIGTKYTTRNCVVAASLVANVTEPRFCTHVS